MYIIYVTDSCPGCTQVKTRIAQRAPAVQFQFRYADRDPNAQRELFAMGSRSVPTMRGPDGRVYRNPAEILRALGI